MRLFIFLISFGSTDILLLLMSNFTSLKYVNSKNKKKKNKNYIRYLFVLNTRVFILFLYFCLPIGRCTSKLLRRSRHLSRGKSPILGGKLAISLHPASNSASDVILPNSSGNDTRRL